MFVLEILGAVRLRMQKVSFPNIIYNIFNSKVCVSTIKIIFFIVFLIWALAGRVLYSTPGLLTYPPFQLRLFRDICLQSLIGIDFEGKLYFTLVD